MEEIWKDIKDYEGLYQVSNLGRVKSLPNTAHKNEIILKPSITNGYYSVALNKSGKQKRVYIHRLVAEAFIPNPHNLSQVGHKDENNYKTGDGCNNCVDNLEWCTQEENSNTPMRAERLKKNNHGMKGKQHTEETKQKMSEAQKGEKGYWYGKNISEETKRKIGEANRGENNKRCRAVKCIETNKIYFSAKNAQDSTGCRANTITACCKGKRKTCGGYHWEYASEAEARFNIKIVGD